MGSRAIMRSNLYRLHVVVVRRRRYLRIESQNKAHSMNGLMFSPMVGCLLNGPAERDYEVSSFSNPALEFLDPIFDPTRSELFWVVSLGNRISRPKIQRTW